MIAITVQRGEGLHPGDDIIEPLLGNIAVALSRGRAEIDAAMDIQPVELTIAYRSGLRLGQLAEIHDSLLGESFRGKITGIAHTIEGHSVTSRLNIERPTNV